MYFHSADKGFPFEEGGVANSTLMVGARYFFLPAVQWLRMRFEYVFILHPCHALAWLPSDVFQDAGPHKLCLSQAAKLRSS